MFHALLRVLFAFVVACLVAAAVQVTYAFAPAEYLPNPMGAGELILLTATHFAIFAAPFALVVAAIGEWQSVRSWLYYALGGIGIALAGFLAQFSSEAGGPTVLNAYALKAFVTPGFVAGFVYWMLSGRRAGEDPPETAKAEQMREPKPKAIEPAPKAASPAPATPAKAPTAQAGTTPKPEPPPASKSPVAVPTPVPSLQVAKSSTVPPVRIAPKSS